MACLKPKLKRVPKGDWFCKACKDAKAAAKAAAAPPKRGRAAAAKPAAEAPEPKRRSTRAR